MVSKKNLEVGRKTAIRQGWCSVCSYRNAQWYCVACGISKPVCHKGTCLAKHINNSSLKADHKLRKRKGAPSKVKGPRTKFTARKRGGFSSLSVAAPAVPDDPSLSLIGLLGPG